MENTIALEAPADTLRTLMDRLTGPDFEWSEPVSVTSVADALDSPIGGEEIRRGLEMAILILKTGAAALAFAKPAHDVTQLRTGAVVIVKDASKGNKKGTITGSSSVAEVQDVISR